MREMKFLILSCFLATILSSCASSTQDKINELQLTQEQLQNKASANLANISQLKDRVIKYRAEAKDLQKKSDKIGKDINDLKSAYAQFDDPNNDSAIAVNKELVSKMKQKVDIDEEINRYRSQANISASEIDNLKSTSQVLANQASKISLQIRQLNTKG